jgi:hypothetical protein
MNMPDRSETLKREKALASALMDVASDLRLVGAADFIAFVRTGQLANIGNIVTSSTELYFRPGTLRFGRSCEADLTWDGPPHVSLALEFCHDGVMAFFRLILAANHACVEMDGLRISPEVSSHEAETERLVAALAAARLRSRQIHSNLALPASEPCTAVQQVGASSGS